MKKLLLLTTLLINSSLFAAENGIPVADDAAAEIGVPTADHAVEERDID